MGSRINSKYNRKTAEKKAQLIFLGAMILLGGCATLAYVLQAPVTGQDGCTTASLGEFGSTLLLIDATDELSATWRKIAADVTRDVGSSMPRFSKLSIFPIHSSNHSQFGEVFSKCSPGEAGFADYVANGRNLVEGRQSEFVESAVEATERILANSSSTRSRIVEALRDASAVIDRSHPVTLVLMSDLIENSSIINLYNTRFTFEDFMKSPSRAVLDQLDLQGVRVLVVAVAPPTTKLAPAIQANAVGFWQKFLTHVGAEVHVFKGRIPLEVLKDGRRTASN